MRRRRSSPAPLAAIALVAAAAVLTFAQTTASIPARDDEVVGPFASWTNLKTVYRAVGDGVADDTAAIQKALDVLGTPGHAPVLFVPRGTYRITNTLTLAYTINVSVVGEDPATTTIVWDGVNGGTMLAINGLAYSRFVRLAFDGKKRASVAVEQSWDKARPHFDTGNEYADDFFTDLEFGIHGGFKGYGFAETTIRRARFTRNTKAGVALGNFNALDIWVWYSTFEDCGAGVTNIPGAGNFHVYNSVFRRSTVADLAMGNTGGFSARGNFSIGSKAFFTGGRTNNPATISIQGNTIVDPVDSTAIALGNQGPGWIADNVVRSLPAAMAPVVSWVSFVSADVTSIGNTFTVAAPLRSSGRLTSIDDRIIEREDLRPFEPAMPPARPNLKRQIFEVPAGADAAAIQLVVSAAARQNGRRPVVHIPHGVYEVASTINVAPSDVQIVGDGYGTTLRWTGAGPGPVLRVGGPSKATLREIQVDGAGKADGIAIEAVDQIGSRVYLGQTELRSGKQSDLFIDRLDHANVQLEDAGYAYSPDGTSIRVVGGPRLAAGEPARGKVNVFSGASSGHRTSYDVSGGAAVLVRDVWYEGGAGPGFARIHDRAVFTVDGARLATPAGGMPPAFDIRGLSGRVTVLATDMDDRVIVSGDGSKAMVLGVSVFAAQRAAGYFQNTASPPARFGLLNARHLALLPGIRSTATANSGSVDAPFIKTMLSQARGEMPQPLEALAAGVTDVRLFRVWIANGINNVTLRP